jgi:hypothetical protein
LSLALFIPQRFFSLPNPQYCTKHALVHYLEEHPYITPCGYLLGPMASRCTSLSSTYFAHMTRVLGYLPIPSLDVAFKSWYRAPMPTVQYQALPRGCYIASRLSTSFCGIVSQSVCRVQRATQPHHQVITCSTFKASRQ